ncbi:hypothetical protein IWQ62_004578 [Dispira parvispora]|uniref:FAD/NAD(P)-binding domain-containing protein n=1 Tax=Dispira parvispora TaxID=1520584 RepID=A0A9W8ASB1_9FUNG|nr:hypothetical protein IWQ62_004578 [Dispira parvispora]
MSDPVHVVIIGASVARVATAKQLVKSLGSQRMRVTIIDKVGQFYCLPMATRGVVNKDFAKKTWFPLDEWVQGSPPHELVHGTVSEVHTSHVVVKETGTTYPYNYLVVASGMSYCAPFQFQTTNPAEWLKASHAYIDQIAKATEILLVGDGSTGVELAAKLKTTHPNKHVILLHSKEWLLPEDAPLKFRRGVTDRPSVEIEADWLIPTIGETETQTSFMDELLASSALELIHPQTRALRVSPTLQLVHDNFSHIFAVRDVNDTLGIKMAYRAYTQGNIAGENLARLIKHHQANQGEHTDSKPPPQLKEYKPPSTGSRSLALGTNNAIALIPGGWTVSGWLVGVFKRSSVMLWQINSLLNKPMGR